MFRAIQAAFTEELIDLRSAPPIYCLAALSIVGLLVLGFALDTESAAVHTVVLDFTQDAESRQLIQEFENTRYFTLVGEVRSEQGLRDAIVSGRAQVGIKIPLDYSSNLKAGRQGQVQVIVDGSDARTALQVLNSSQQLGVLKSLDREGISPAMYSIDVRPHLLFNPALRSLNSLMPGVIAVLTQFWSLGIVPLVFQRTRKSAKNSPLRASVALLVGKGLFYLLLGVILAVIQFALMVYVFSVPINGSIALLLGLSPLFVAAALSAGLAIFAWTEPHRIGVSISLMFLLLSLTLSGFAFPRQSMAPASAAIAAIFPVTFGVELYQGIILRGAGFTDLAGSVLALAVLGAIFGTAAALGFRKRWRAILPCASAATDTPSGRR